MISQRRILRQEQERWKSVVKDGRLSEGARRKAVEQRLHELLVKFRYPARGHMSHVICHILSPAVL